MKLKPWAILSSSCQVECAHCTYMAAIAESCTHVGALLFKIEVAVQIWETKTVTAVTAFWVMLTSVDKIQAEVEYFSSAGAKKKVLNKCINGE